LNDSALEVALALWRTPTMRAVLRTRPLPDNVSEVIELASGNPERLEESSTRTGEPPERVLDAARFYVREILLCADSDAYRVLGVSSDAEQGEIKQNHRSLQRWLHPDRRGDSWEAIFATRINSAWGELRSPDRRAAYDARLVSAKESPILQSEPPPVLVRGWRSEPAPNPRQRGWIAAVAALGACVWLIVLLVQREDAPAPAWRENPVEIADVAPEPTVPLERVPVTVAAKVRNATTVNRSVTQMPQAEPPGRVVAPVVAPVLAEPVVDPKQRPQHAREIAAVVPAPQKEGVPTAEVAVVADQDLASRAPNAPPKLPTRQAAVDPLPERRATVKVKAPVLKADEFEQATLARHRGLELAKYLGSGTERVPPIWRSVVAQDAAASIRQRLQTRGSTGSATRTAARLAGTVWRIGDERATMTAVIVADGSIVHGSRLRVDLEWRDGAWLVDAIETN